MKKVAIQVSFTGTVEVSVPDHLTDEQAHRLADHFALCRVIATTDNPDAPDEDACEEFAEAAGLNESDAESLWDATSAEVQSGEWTSIPPPEAATYRCTNIQWDTTGDEEPPELPKTLDIAFTSKDMEDIDNVEDALSDALTEKTGFCHNGFQFEKI